MDSDAPITVELNLPAVHRAGLTFARWSPGACRGCPDAHEAVAVAGGWVECDLFRGHLRVAARVARNAYDQLPDVLSCAPGGVPVHVVLRVAPDPEPLGLLPGDEPVVALLPGGSATVPLERLGVAPPVLQVEERGVRCVVADTPAGPAIRIAAPARSADGPLGCTLRDEHGRETVVVVGIAGS